jgi:hypothetical protein
MMNKMLLALVTLTLLASTAYAATLQDVENSFYPYKNGAPQVAGITEGMVINTSNWQVAKDALDPVTLEFVKNGDYEISVAKTTSFDLHPNYVEATKARLGKVSLGAEIGMISGADAGRPFPEEPSMDDPRAGEKLAWNYKYGYNWGDSAAIKPFYWQYRNMKTGKTERNVTFNFNFLNFAHRVVQDPMPEILPNPSEFFRGTYVQVLEPFDVKNTQLLIHRFEDDQKRDNTYLYLGFQRRVRRLSSGQVTDAFLGSDLMIEDFEGYNGRIADMNWKYLGTKELLMPFYNHNEMHLGDEKDEDGYQFVNMIGKGGCFPEITWQLRKVYEVEAVPVDPNHPLSKRIHFFDAQTFTIPRTNIYDRKGDIWKSWTIAQAHPDFHLPQNKGTGVSIDDSFSMIDVQAEHCTTGKFKGIVDPELSPATKFTVQNMRASGH